MGGGGWKGKENERWAFFWNYEGGAVSYMGGSFLLRGGIMRIVLLALFGHKLLVFLAVVVGAKGAENIITRCDCGRVRRYHG